MSPSSFDAFLNLARRDAALQERVVAALQQADPAKALLTVTRDAGFQFSEADLGAVLERELSESELDAVAGGSIATGPTQAAGFRAPGEWFAESLKPVGSSGKIEGH